MFQRLKLRGQIFLGFIIPVSLFAITALAIAGLVVERERRSNLLENDKKLYSGLKSVSESSALSDRDITLIILYGIVPQNPSYDFEADYKKNSARLRNNIDAFKKLFILSTEPQQRVRINNLSKLWEQNWQVYDRALRLVKNGNYREAATYWNSQEVNNLVTAMNTNTTEFLDSQQKTIDAQSAQLNWLVNAQAVLIFGVALLVAIISLILGLKIAAIITNSVNLTIGQVSDNSSEIAISIATQERVIADQSAAVSQTTVTMEELGVSSQQSADQAKASTAGAQEALELSQSGKESLQRTLEGIGSLREKVLAFAGKIMQLSEQTAQISTVSELVAGLAKQTNTLALNAAVEAARAGDQGKGFSVVAQEVRKLADQSKKSAQKINILIEEIQASINSTVIVTDESTKTATESIQLAQLTAEAFESISKAIDTVFINTQQIALSSKQQALGVQQIVSAMNAINLGARETAKTITQIKTATEHLSESAETLKEKV